MTFTFTLYDAARSNRFWAKVEVVGDCWLWTASATKSGYGNFKHSRGLWVLAHRYAYAELVEDIPEAYQIDHVKELGCTSRLCVNFTHLEAVPQQVNLARRPTENMWPVREYCKRGHHKGHGACRECQKMHVNEYAARMREQYGPRWMHRNKEVV